MLKRLALAALLALAGLAVAEQASAQRITCYRAPLSNDVVICR
jgi:hypothetical protein